MIISTKVSLLFILIIKVLTYLLSKPNLAPSLWIWPYEKPFSPRIYIYIYIGYARVSNRSIGYWKLYGKVTGHLWRLPVSGVRTSRLGLRRRFPMDFGFLTVLYHNIYIYFYNHDCID